MSILVALVLAVGWVREPETRPTDSWAPHSFMGSDYRLVISSDDFMDRVGGGKLVRELPSLREAARRVSISFGSAQFVDTNANPVGTMLMPKRTEATKRAHASYGPESGTTRPEVTGNAHADLPLFVSISGTRPDFWLEDDVKFADPERFSAWQRQHPNFIGFQGFDELDSDLEHFEEYLKWEHPEDPELQVHFRKRYPFPKPGEGVAAYQWLKTAYGPSVTAHFGCTNLWSLMSFSASYLSICASFGVGGLFYEATTQMHYPWQLAGAYLRGAARQWHLPWAWYGAHWYGGVPRKDRTAWPAGESQWCCYDDNQPLAPDEPRYCKSIYYRPHLGSASSLLERQYVYGWLIGSSFYWPEHWHNRFATVKDGRHVLSEFGKSYEEFYALAKRTDRGVSLTPLAVFTPIDEPMETSMWCAGFRDPYGQVAVFSTLIPMNCPHRSRFINRVGEQGCLYNSEFGELFDVLQPDAGQNEDEFVKALSAYPCAILAGGGFRQETLDVASLVRYVRGGGTLIVASDLVVRGLIPESLTGVRFGEVMPMTPVATYDGERERTQSFATHVFDGNRLTFLLDRYAFREAEPTTARVIARTDYRDQPVIFANEVGKGRVISVAADRFLPSYYAEMKPESDYEEEFTRIVSGRQTFELLRHVLRTVRDETWPIKVSGNVQYGINRTRTGYLVWVFNNAGVVKFTDEPEEFDQTKTALVSVELKGLKPKSVRDVRTGESLGVRDVSTFTLAPGHWRLIEIVK